MPMLRMGACVVGLMRLETCPAGSIPAGIDQKSTEDEAAIVECIIVGCQM